MKNFLKNIAFIVVLSVLPNFIIGIIRFKRQEPIPYVLNKMKSAYTDSDEISISSKPSYDKAIGDMSRLSLLKGDSVLRYVDNFGFSNIVVNKSPEILFIGDSFLNDPALNTAEGIQSLTNKLLNKNISYNLSKSNSAGFSVFNQLRQSIFTTQPRLIIFEVVERNSFERVTNAPNQLRSGRSVPYRFYYFDLFFGNNYKGFDLKRLFQTTSTKIDTSSIGVAHECNGNKVWFLNNRITRLSDDRLNTMVDSMAVIDKMLEAQKIKIVFVIAPDKESLYPELFGRSSLKALHSKMKSRNLEFIDMFSLLENQGEKYYYAGDTHWNGNSVRLLSEEVAQKYRCYFLSGN